MPVYTVQDEDKLGPLRTLHRNYLLPLGFVSQPEIKPRTKVNAVSRLKSKIPPTHENAHENVDEEVDEVLCPEVTIENYPVSLTPIDSPCIDSVSLGDVSEDTSSKKDGERQSDDCSGGVEISDSPLTTPPIAPRRSLRSRRPIDRLNLCHVVDIPSDTLMLVTRMDSLVGKLLDKSVDPGRSDVVLKFVNKLLD